MRRIQVKNATKLFTDEMLIYSLSDFSFNKPIQVKFILFLFGLFIIWALPLMIIFRIFNPPMVILYLGPVVGGAALFSGPYFGGKTFISWAKCFIKYIFSPKRYYDGHGRRQLTKAKINHVYVVSREEDFEKLRKMIEEENSHE